MSSIHEDSWCDLAFGGGVFLAFGGGNSSLGYGQIARSTDKGKSWSTAINLPKPTSSNTYWYNGVYGDGVFIVFGDSNFCARSTDGGVSWQLTEMPSANGRSGWSAAVYGE
jgi:hypothetical protein